MRYIGCMTVDDYKLATGCKRDADLARTLGLSRAAVCLMRKRGYVPRKYVETRSRYFDKANKLV